jgi:hypothetical protein
MTQFDEHNLPDELREVEARLCDARPTFTQLELDALKLRAMAKSSTEIWPVSARTRRAPMRSRVLTLALTALLLGGTTAGGIAAGGNSGGNSANAQYKPGKGCGDTNHTHTGPPGNPGNFHCSADTEDNGPSGSLQASAGSSPLGVVTGAIFRGGGPASPPGLHRSAMAPRQRL